MKIGITTYWRGTSNYGQIVQHWALQTVLKDMGHSPFLIRFYPGYNHGILKRWLKLLHIVDYARAIRDLLKGNSDALKRILHDKKRDFSAFRENNLDVSKQKYFRLSDLQHNPPMADVYVTGSDQVWSQLLSNKENEFYFLNFGSSDVRRIAYAPSFSMDAYPPELLQNLRSNLSRFYRISCREYSGVDICKQVGYGDAQKVLDPTLLLRKKDYLKLIKRCHVEQNQNYVFIYSLNIASPNDIRWDELKKAYKKHSFIVTPSDGYFSGKELFGNEVVYAYSTIQGWLTDIYNSSMVVTPSFHGIALSILLEKEFVYTPLEGACAKGNNRILDLLTDLKLMDRVLTSERTYEQIVSKKINWSDVNKYLAELRAKSLVFLKNSLN